MKYIFILTASLMVCTTTLLAQTATVPPNFGEGDAGTSSNPYKIAILDNLYWLSQNSSYCNKYFIQTANIDADSTQYWNGGAGFPPIGSFTGHYHGQGRMISNLHINRPSSDYVGLFSSASGATIDSLGLVNVAITGSSLVGGIAGWFQSVTVSDCYSTGSITGSSLVGGIVGQNYTDGAASLITNCYSSASVSGNSTVGGIAGDNLGSFTSSYATISYCYSSGTITGSSSVGGITGRNYARAIVTRCFWDTETTGQGSECGSNENGAILSDNTGLSTLQMKIRTNFISAGWNVSVWFMDAGINDGYPYLSWQNPGGSALPVELKNFSAAANHNGVELKWKTATEINNAGFAVERRSVSSGWTELGFVKGAGSSAAAKEYSFSDSKVCGGSYVYRLKQIDDGGAFTYSGETTVTVEKPHAFSLDQNYPNPFNPTTAISFTLAEDSPVTVHVYDAIGREAATLVNEKKEAGTYTVPFDAAKLSGGVYYYRMQAGKFIAVKKLLLLK